MEKKIFFLFLLIHLKNFLVKHWFRIDKKKKSYLKISFHCLNEKWHKYWETKFLIMQKFRSRREKGKMSTLMEK